MVTLMLAMFAALAAPAQAKPRGKFDTSEGFYDPRRPDLPRTHRFRLSIESGHIGLSTVLDNSTGLPVRFHFAPLMLGLNYQAQFARVLSARVGANIGYNVANSRNAMPLVVNPRAWLGVQGRWVGIHGGYGYLLIFPTTPNGYGGRSELEQPGLKQPHQVGGELSISGRVDKVAFTASVGGQVVFATLCHLSWTARPRPRPPSGSIPWSPWGSACSSTAASGGPRPRRNAPRRPRGAGCDCAPRRRSASHHVAQLTRAFWGHPTVAAARGGC